MPCGWPPMAARKGCRARACRPPPMPFASCSKPAPRCGRARHARSRGGSPRRISSRERASGRRCRSSRSSHRARPACPSDTFSLPGMLRAVARVTVFGAGAAGTALAIHLARKGEDATLWASEHDGRALQQLEADGRHPALNERLPATLKLHGPDALGQAAAGVEVAVLAANSGGARSLAGMVTPVLGSSPIAVSIAKGLEPESMLRMSQVYGEALPDSPVVALSGPSLATEIADGLLTAVAMACPDTAALDRAAEAFRSPTFLVDPTDDVIGVEVCGVAKNVAAIAAGVLEGMQQHRQLDMKNARAAMFTRAVHEMADLVGAMGGRPDTAFGLAGMGDLLVTSLGGRNRLYGETIGLGAEPTHTLQDMIERGLTVEGAESALDVHRLATDVGLDLPVHEVVYRVVHEGAAPESILEAL